jgi:hypothetical protein
MQNEEEKKKQIAAIQKQMEKSNIGASGHANNMLSHIK